VSQKPKKKPPPAAGDSHPVFSDAAGPFNNAFAKLAKTQPPVASPGGAEATPKSPSAAEVKRRPAPARAVVRLERKGRGGKEVTVVEQLELSPQDLASWVAILKHSLGTGGAVEDGSLVLQGDHRERVRAWLEKHGVKKVSVG
jgi:translation initiation factor 1